MNHQFCDVSGSPVGLDFVGTTNRRMIGDSVMSSAVSYGGNRPFRRTFLGLFCVAVFLLNALSHSSLAESIVVGQIGTATISHDSSKRLGGVEVSVNGISWRPFAGSHVIGPNSESDSSIPFDVDVEIVGDVLRLKVDSMSEHARGINPGQTEGLSEWRRVDLSRYAQHYGQAWWQKVVYSVKGDFWFSAHWVMEESDATKWKAANQANRGALPFSAALEVRYEPDTNGNYLPIHEVLELRVSDHLWDVVPRVRQKSSEYSSFLAESVFVDLWGGSHVADATRFLKVLNAIGRGRQRYLTILQNWGTGGFDALLPDSMRLPEYPPNPSVGTVDELRELCRLGKSMGRFGFRTNYVYLQKGSPSFRDGSARFSVDSDGKPRTFTAPANWLKIADRGDTEIQQQFSPNASFTDQITSGAAPWAWHDFAAEGGSRSIRRTLQYQQALALLIKRIHEGPLGSESLIDQHLIGEFVDTGDFGISNGNERLVSPEYKLRRLHHLTGYHGVGLMYRFFETPPFKRFHAGLLSFKDDQALLDNYRACEILFGNGAYVCHDFANWNYYLTECLLVGNLQRHYAMQRVKDVRYWHEERWVNLEELVRSGTVPNIIPWLPQTEAYGRIRVEYQNGVTVVVNRLDDVFVVKEACEGGVRLPKSGWVMWRTQPELLAYSAFWPGTRHRVDYMLDRSTELTFLDPRGRELLGVKNGTMWEEGKIVVTALVDQGVVAVDGQRITLERPEPLARTTLNFDFDKGIDGWRLTRGVLRGESRAGCLHLDVVAPDVYIFSPKLRVPGDAVSAIKIRMKVTGESVKSDGLFFTTEQSPNIHGNKRFGLSVIPDGRFHEYEIKVRAHPKWRGNTITGLRLDPIRGATQAKVDIDYIRGE